MTPRDDGAPPDDDDVAEGPGSDLDALSAQVGDDAVTSDERDTSAEGDDDAKLDLGAIAHSSMPRPPEPRDDAGPRQGARAEPDAKSSQEPSLAVSVRLLQGLGLGFALGVACGWVLFAGRAPATEATAVEEVTPSPQAPPSPPTRPPAAVDPQSPPLPGSPVAVEPAAAAVEPAVPTAVPAEASPPPARGRSVASAEPPRRPPAAAPDPSPAPVEPASPSAPEPAAGSTPRGMDSLLEEALDRKPGAAPEPPPAAALPQAPDQKDVGKAIRVLIPAISGCAAGQKGVAVVSLVVRNTGRVASARVSGAPFEGTSAGRCMEGVVRKARFPRFARPTFRVRLPLKIE